MLSRLLFGEIPVEFLRVLSNRGAAMYIDVLDALEREALQRNEGLLREEAIEIVTGSLAQNPDFVPEEDEAGFVELPAREKARRVLDYLVRCGWMEEPVRPDWQRVLFFDAHGSTLLTALRRIARPDAAVFSDSLIGVCSALLNSAALERRPWEHLENCRKGTQTGLGELRTMQKSVERFTRRQLDSRSLGDNLRVVFDEYSEQVGKTCYAELIRSQLHTALDVARERLREMEGDTDLVHKMQAEVLRRDGSLDAETATSRVRNRLADLTRALEQVLPLADEIDRRTAEFTRRSHARFRYLQEIVGQRRGQVKELFEKVNGAFVGWRLAELDDALSLPPLRLAETRLLDGRDSLYEPPRRRTVEENAPLDDEVSDSERDHARLRMESALRDALTVNRANRFVADLPGGKGARISSAELPVRTDDDLADIIALLLHAEATDARYRVEVERLAEDSVPLEFDTKIGCRLERFHVLKK